MKKKMLQLEEPPVAIAVTWGKKMIAECGGWRAFYRYFLEWAEDAERFEDAVWFQKNRNAPKQDILYVYIVVNNQIRYKMLYAGHETGDTIASDVNGDKVMSGGRLRLALPLVRAPKKIQMKGTQGFRYLTTEPF